jgi:hypothetical protein
VSQHLAQCRSDFLRAREGGAFQNLGYRHAGMPALLAMIKRFWNTMQQYRRA